jgi:DNA invertase Pin-like site-specific DNA recombinase
MGATRWEELGDEKIQPWHLDRLAVVYIRQSTAQQVVEHPESARVQYGLAARAQALGWAPERIVVIADDLGKSGTSADGRLGFQRLVSEVSLGHLGLILGVQMSRLARSGTDWHQLLELCALFGTLLADWDGLYDPARYNDRLLLGLKGTLSEAELHRLQQRMQQGRLSKARRGELAVPLPTGYIRRASGEVAFDPDEQVQHVVRLIFRTFEERGTLNAVLRYLVHHQIQVGIRVREGPGKGELAWHRPNRALRQGLLKNPVYTGAYVYGRRPVDPRRQQPGRPRTGRVVAQAGAWQVRLPDQFPAYISGEQYERNLARLQANRARADAIGVARQGAALLAGLAVCARCGCRMTVRYSGSPSRPTYVCTRQMVDYGGEVCQYLAGPCVERFVSQWVLAALEPAALELSLAAAQQLERERAELERLWQQRRERAAYEAERAARQYRLCEPEHRLVARQLEREWEAKLLAQQQLEEDYQRFRRQLPRVLSEPEREAIRRLAADIPALWAAPTTTAAERKEILRQVIERVVVDAPGTSERVRVSLHWVGGARTEGELVRPVARWEQASYFPQLCERVRALAAAGRSAGEIAAQLDSDGYRPPKRRERFGRPGVSARLRRLGLRAPRGRSPASLELGEAEWELAALAQRLGMPPVTLYTWIGRGWVRARQLPRPPRRWIVWADPAEVERLRERRQRPGGYYTRRRWVENAAQEVATIPTDRALVVTPNVTPRGFSPGYLPVPESAPFAGTDAETALQLS